MGGTIEAVRATLLRLSSRLHRDAVAHKYAAADPPLRAELFSADQMERHGAALAESHKVGLKRGTGKLLSRLVENEAILVGACGLLMTAVKANYRISPAGDWLLDNFYLIEEQIRTARRHLPKEYSRELPLLDSGHSAGIPRVYDIALEAISHGDGRVDPESLNRFVSAYQSVADLRLGELWAIPIMLRLALVENLRRVAVRVAAGVIDRNQANSWADRMIAVAEQDPKSLIVVIADMAASDPPLVSAFVAELARRLQGHSSALALPLTWIEQRLSESGLTIEQLVQAETQSQAANQVSVSNSIGSLRFLGAMDWRDFVERMSAVEQTLREDPGGVYSRMDFATRDRYRHMIEDVARFSGHSEVDVARHAIGLAQQGAAVPGTDSDVRAAHVGFYLIDKGLSQLERATEARLPPGKALIRLFSRNPLLVYLGGIAVLTALYVGNFVEQTGATALPGWLLALILVCAMLGTSQLAVALVNWLVTLLATPHALPRMDYSKGIAPQSRTLVVVPSMLSCIEAAEGLLEALEVRFLANRDPCLHFALLTDFVDAVQETLSGDAALLEFVRERVEGLNLKYGNAGDDIFYLFHRPRLWNARERLWMGYERKRGKLGDLNALLRSGSTRPFSLVVGATGILLQVKYVITLDTDTQLPRDSARECAATMAHPLNHPRYDETLGRVTEGYGILQPRMAVSLSSANRSPYAQLFGSEPGVDPYTRAVSDVYQDLFAEGSFIGKGIYDVDAFETALKDRFPENRILSHDLLEGCYARAGLLSDVELYDDHPSQYRADVSRRHRWIRGDWQIATWAWSIVPGRGRERLRNPLSKLSQWKILDNLRRSLVPAGLTLLFLLGWIAVPDSLYWTLAVLGIFFLPPLVAACVDMLRKPRDVQPAQHFFGAMRIAGRHFSQAALALACLPYEALFSLDAILRTSARVLFTHRRLLEWNPSAELQRQYQNRNERNPDPGGMADLSRDLSAMWMAPAIAVTTAIGLAMTRPAALIIATPVLLLWFASPVCVWWLSRPRAPRESRLTADESGFLRRLARRTWAFFDRFVGPEDHWLPPDNYQEHPVAVVAHRTSPTNMGLALLANLSAYDFGYISAGSLVARTTNTLQTMAALDRHHGHFYNWYDTLSLRPLLPLYVSSVDSGNLSGHLLTLRAGLLGLADQKILPQRWLEGLHDTLSLLDDVQPGPNPGFDLESPPTTLSAASITLKKFADYAAQISVSEEASGGGAGPDWAQALARQCRDMLDDLAHFFPDSPARQPETGGIPTLRELARRDGETGRRAGARIEEIERLARQAGEFAAVEVEFLFDRPRQLLAIGYNVADNRLDSSYYDLLASEARLSSFVAIAQGHLPQESWFALGRLLAANGGDPILLSWSGSMFEYLMPMLVMPSFENTLLAQTCNAAVKRQIAYGHQRGVPWGVSESGYNTVDAALNYQYRAFGVPGLGLKRGLAEDLVIAPYASALALMVMPEAACENLQRLSEEGLQGEYGMYEAVDYTPARLPRGQTKTVVRSFMAHHQGMILLSLGSLLLDRPMQRRFASDPLFQATMLLLQERIPKATALHLTLSGMTETHTQSTGPEMPMRVLHSADTAIPEVQLLSNGRYHVMVTNAGGGYSRWKDLAVSRWREDGTCDNWGTFCYIRDVETGEFWSTAHQPTLRRAESYEAIFSEGRAEFRRHDHDLETHTEIVVSPEDDIELRRIRITNRSQVRRTIDVTTYAEVVIAPVAADALHPAFSNLFVQTEIVRELQAIVCTRRPRSVEEQMPWMFHLVAIHGVDGGEISYETDRMRFIGRSRTIDAPQALIEAGALSGNQGSVLDPIVAIRCRITLDPEQTATIDAVYGVAASRDACLTLVGKYRDRNLADRVFDLAWTHNWVTLRQINASESDAQLYARLAGSVLYANSSLRAAPGILTQNRRSQSGLWGYAISGDLPIVLLQIADAENFELVRQLVQAHAYWRLKGLAVDLVIWNEDHAGYRQLLQEQIMGLIAAGVEAHVMDRPGGIFVRRAEQIADEDRILFQSVARAVISDKRGTLVEQIDRGLTEARGRQLKLPRFTPVRVARTMPVAAPTLPTRELILANDIGGFSADGSEYIITTSPGISGSGQVTPAPWVNVLANAHFGTVISESGLAYTWSENAHEFRLTPWGNDPVTDASGEAFYIRDEESGVFWSPTPLPCPGKTPYVTRHGFGYSIFEHTEDGIHSQLRVYVDLETSVKYSALTVTNRSGRVRQLSATGYVEWVLGDLRSKSAMHVITEIESESGALCARNAYYAELAGRTAFFDVDDATRTLTGDRTEFLGRNGTLGNPAALSRTQLSNRVGAALDPCAAIQVCFQLGDGQVREIVFRLGVAEQRRVDDAGKLMLRLRGAAVANEAFDKVRRYWQHTLSAVQVETPDPSVDVLANGWLLYQTLACRLWARSGYYQSGGAFGFRDQLQDTMALIHAEPRLVREHLLRCAGRQFSEGDVQHWWHPPSGRGVRTHCSDDYLWLPWATCRYVLGTGDRAVLDEPAHFLEGRKVPPEEDSYYDMPGRSAATATLYQHCVRAIENGLNFGEHGLPLMGTGDWNDGMNLVGMQGRGESVWLGFFLYQVLMQFAEVAHIRGDAAFTERCRLQAAQVRRNIEQHGWDGGWYRRAWFDDGTPLGASANVECQIDSIAQSWSVLSGAGNAARSRTAMLALDRRLVRRERGLVQLLDPPFDKSDLNPGYIKGYVPGVRENGGQYTHAAIWAVMAFAELGDNRRAWEVFNMINPVNHGTSASAIATYKVEPYVVAADVYAVAPHTGRGGWSWYTGSAGWMYRLIVESLLGLRREADRLRVTPCLPADWPGIKLRYRYGETVYSIEVLNLGNETGVTRVSVDGVEQPDHAVPLVDDRREHAVEVRIYAAPLPVRPAALEVVP